MEGSENLVTDNAEVCEMFREQFVLAYSYPLPNDELPLNDTDLDSQGTPVQVEVQATKKYIKVSIKELQSSSRDFPDGVPVI